MNSSSSNVEKNVQLRIVKVGGSLFTMPDLKNRLLDWSDSVAEDGCVDVWVAGGGSFVDQVRIWRDLHGLNEKVAHDASIGLMSQTAAIFQSMFLDWPLLRSVHQLNTVAPIATTNVVFDCSKWALNNVALDSSWETTSDTISLRLATAIGARRLFLLKSKTPKSGQVTDLIEDGLIDQKFTVAPENESQLRASITNLRESNEIFELNW